MGAVDRIFDRIVRKQANRKRVVRIAAVGIGAAFAVSAIHYVTVRPGDTLSSLAAKACGSASDWTGIYQQNMLTIGNNPNLIFPGQHLTFKCNTAAITADLAVPQQKEPQALPQQHSGYQAAQAPEAIYHGSSSMQACIIARESGGDSQVVNASGHYGLYQFSFSTWEAHGGAPGDFGHASVAEQNQVYYNTVAQDGYSDWAPYDGC